MIFIKKKYKFYIFYIFTILLLLSLGTWQLYRLSWKLGVIDKLNARIKLAPVKLDDFKEIDIDNFEFRSVKLTGHFLNQYEIYLYGGSRVYKGEAGYFILTPFQTTDNQYILINRGWVPEAKKNKENRPQTLIEEETEIEGALLKGERRTALIPENNLEKNIWLWIDLAGARKYTNLDLANFFILAKEDSDKNKLPIGKNLTLNIKNDHLAYAITWYLFAIIFAVIFYIYQNQQNKSK